MKNNFYTLLIAALFAGFIGFMVYASTRVGLNFDASYNLLSYQSLFNGTGFNYAYGGNIIPFDPVISTGPELYAPTFLIWKLMGRTDYYAAIYVLIAYYAAFLGFLLFVVLKDSASRLIALAGFLVLFFGNFNFFDTHLFIDPLGEVIACFLVFAGFYFLHKEKQIFGFLLLGFALDIKTNIIVALLPALGIFFLVKYALPEFQKGKRKKLSKLGIKIVLILSLIAAPTILYSKVAPQLLLNSNEKMVRAEAQKNRSGHVTSRAFGQLIDLKTNPTENGLRAFWSETQTKIDMLKSFFNNNNLALVSFLAALALLLFYSRKHFSFYLFLVAAFFMLWWLFATKDPWYRYFFVTDFMVLLGFASLLPYLIRSKKKYLSFPVLGLVAFVVFSRFSPPSIMESLDQNPRNEIFAMSKEVAKIDEKNIYTYGWFQCPQMMLLTNKRFQDYSDKRSASQVKNSKQNLYLLTSIENTLIQDEMNGVVKNFKLNSSHGSNKLYRIN